LLKRTIPEPDPEALRRFLPPEPFRIEPIFTPRIWGSRSLAPLFPEKTNLDEPIGEVWLSGVDCRVATGPFAGKTLGEAWREMPTEWRGEKFREPGDFPLLLKFILPREKLSIQVHPDDAYASVHEKAAGGYGKTEMWHVVSAEPGANVLIGLKPGVDKEKFLEALQAHRLEDLFVAHAAHAGDTFFLPAGTPHTIGPGMVICEVQQYSDLTYRVYDYGRVDAQGKPRELHIEKALEVMDFGASQGGQVASRNPTLAKQGFSNLVRCAYFWVSRLDFDRNVHFRPAPPKLGEGVFRLEVILVGEGTLTGLPRRGATGEFPFRQGECWFVPANTFTMSCGYHSKGKVSLLTASVP
jgi:mannose-6-phosphate isomerase